MNQTLYMDYNATAPVRPEARAAVARALELDGNPSSVHRLGRVAHRVVEDARESLRTLVGASDAARIIFTSGGTEANSLAILGSGRERIVASAVEHPAVRVVRDGVEFVSVDENGVIDLSALETMLGETGEKTIVSVMLANNETGVIEPLARVVELAHAKGALVHTDAVQAVGKIEINFDALGVDYLTLSAHKFGGPKGVGALVATPNAPITPLVTGGGQEGGLRGGTENVPGIAGMAAAAMAAHADLAEEGPHLARLRDALESRILEIEPQALCIGAKAERLPNTSFITMPGVSSETQVAGFDLAGICVSAGSACASGKSKLGPVLAAMGFDEELAKTVLRISIGQNTTEADIEKVVRMWGEIRARALKGHETKGSTAGNAA
ncbi:MAG: cysteine desulfurase [Rhodospirillaceae bacterium]|nr:cysteine desulfurase [Rhodospirillaceae bacterium]